MRSLSSVASVGLVSGLYLVGIANAQRTPDKPVETHATSAQSDEGGSQMVQFSTPAESAIAVQRGGNVTFVLFARGFLQRGLAYYELDTGEWRYEGHVNLLKDQQVVRRFALRYTSADPDTLYLDDQPYRLSRNGQDDAESAHAGRLIVLSKSGDPRQLDRTVAMRSAADLRAVAAAADHNVTPPTAIPAESE